MGEPEARRPVSEAPMVLPKTGLGWRTRAEQVLRGVSLKGKRAVVTGANSGLGVETARVLALAGAEVLMSSRSVQAGERVASELRSRLPAGAGTLQVLQLELADPASVRAFAGQVLEGGRPLHLLVNNAGIMATPLGFAYGVEQQMGVDHLGPFLLTQLLVDRLAASGPARVVNLSSDLHYRGSGEGVLATLESDPRYERRRYSPWGAYTDAKLANILFTRGLARRLPASVRTFAIHPGVIPTNLARHMGWRGTLFRFVGPLMKSVEQGAATTVFACVAPELEGHTGLYLADSNEKRPHRDAMNDGLVERVWTLSEQRVRDAGAETRAQQSS